MATLRFEFSFWPTVATIAGMALAAALGVWQVGRGNEKAALGERIGAGQRDAAIVLPPDEVRAEDLVWRRVAVRGVFVPRHAVFIDNRVLHGIVGYHVLMPLRIGASDRHVLVNRGWMPAPALRNALPEVATPPGEVEVTGLAVVPAPRYFELSANVAEGNVWQNLVLERYRKAVPLALQPVVVRQDNELADGLKRDWSAPELGVEKHFGYAFQWFALCAALLVYYLVTHVKRIPRAA